MGGYIFFHGGNLLDENGILILICHDAGVEPKRYQNNFTVYFT